MEAIAFLFVLSSVTLAIVSSTLEFPRVIPTTGRIDYGEGYFFEDGFESGDFSVWTAFYTSGGCNATVESVDPFNGNYHGDFETVDSSAGMKQAYCYYVLPSARNELYARVYTYIDDGLPLYDDGDKFSAGVGFFHGSQPLVNVRVIREAGVDKFGLTSIPWSQTVDTIYPELDKWFCIEVYWRIHPTEGAGKLWINGVEVLSRTGFDTTTAYGDITQVRVGLGYSINIQHRIEIYSDECIVSTGYIGPSTRALYAFGVVASDVEIPAVKNFYWLFGNQSIKYKALLPSEVTNFASINHFNGLVVWTRQGYLYNSTAIRQFAKTRIVISHIWDFCNVLYPSLSDKMEVVATSTVTYVRDWGNFRNGDLVEMRNETGNTDQLTTVLTSGLATFANVTHIARYDNSRVALFHMRGEKSESGFYVMDLHATTPETEWTGIWHLFPAIKMVRDFPTGKYARWMANGQRWWNLTWIDDRIDALVKENSDIAKKWVIGKSVEGRNITAIVIGGGSRYIIIDGCIHGNEKTTAFACLRIAELLIEYYRSSSSWKTKLTQCKIIIIPVLNPDGFAVGLNGIRYNANGIDLNRNFPPKGSASEPETMALMNLMSNYTPIIYINNHEGYYWYPLDLWYGQYEKEPHTSFTVYALRQANNTFATLRHWGRFTEEGKNVWISQVNWIQRSGLQASAQAYASFIHHASTMLPETFLWSSAWGARKCLWGLDFYSTVCLAHIEHYYCDGGFLFRSDGFVTSVTVEQDRLTITLDTTELTDSSTTVIRDTTGKGKPLTVYIDGAAKSEGDGWTYSLETITVLDAEEQIEVSWS